MSWYTQPMYSALEVALIVLLAILPGSQIAAILLGIIQQKTGLNVNPKATNGDGNDD